MIHRIIVTLKIALAVLLPMSLTAAEVEVHPPVSGVSIVLLKGQLVSGDGAYFHEQTQGITKAIIFLESPGGLVAEGLSIGATIAQRGFSTMIAEGKLCASMCGIIWLSGNNRYLQEKSVVGFHAAYVDMKDGNLEVSGTANATIGSFVSTLGLPLKTVQFVARAPPEDMEFINHVGARVLGIDTVLVEKERVLSEFDRPTSQTLALRYASAELYQKICQSWVPYMPTSIQTSSLYVLREGASLVGEAEFLRMSQQELGSMLSNVPEDDILGACLLLELTLRLGGFETGVYGPGYNCNIAETHSQITLCRTQAFWYSDYLMNRIYLIFRDASNSAMRKRYFKGQRAWMAMRENCEGELKCLSRLYLLRFSELYELVSSK